ncbi:MAG: ADP-forming succinate--CoA ligase subunit beta, partial [Bacteroidota bacterium]|nr:ADP-forming succinate--CoA ligase subunit beta [Bacteroidota bacterium]
LTVAQELSEETGTSWFVVKAQIHAGGRGKGGGVKLAKGIDKVEEVVDSILGMDLVTPQTPPEGKRVHKVLIAEDVYYPGASKSEEYYMSVLLNRSTGRNMIMYSTEGGVDIETVAEETPHLIFTEDIDPAVGLMPFQARRVAFNLGLSGNAFKEMTRFVTALYSAYVQSDSSLFEINPVLKTSDNKILAVDAKVSLDDNALFRHKDYQELRDVREENPIEVEAKEVGLSYVALDGNVGCMVNGAGLAMATMDLIKQAGGEPANFLDVGGTADAARVETAFRLILKDPKVKAILVNIFGGIVRCDRVAQGIVDAYKNMGDSIQVPIIVRLQGTNADIAKDLIDNSGLAVHTAVLFQEAADKVQEVL